MPMSGKMTIAPHSSVPDALLWLGVWLVSAEKGVIGSTILDGVGQACGAQRALAEERRRAESGIKEQEDRFRDGLITALHAAEESDPFASIRGDFDLSAPDSRQWNTSLKLPGSERCRLLRTPPPNPTSASAWTFGCSFRSYFRWPWLEEKGTYEGMVRFVQTALNRPYQPDENATNINQVFFADPFKPGVRLFVSKIKRGDRRDLRRQCAFAKPPASRSERRAICRRAQSIADGTHCHGTHGS